MRVILVGALLTGCADKADPDDSDSGADTTAEAVCEEPAELTCVDDLILDLSLHDDKVSEGDVSTTTDGDDFVTDVDASAGGYNSATSNAWVYLKFTEDGAEKIEIDDETALESMDWDVAARRFIVRLNGGSSGPSCVGAVTFLESSYDDLTEIPDGLSYGVDDYYTSDCTIINDSSGLPDSPQVVLGSWWSYSACVATTSHPHLIQTADGRILKLVIEEYYGTDQEDCNTSDIAGDDSAELKFRWRWMN
ncbi:MAG: hypothetical protein ACI8RZ_001286 [Myxococcota bacterium]|jgi:hypothetical protein